MASGAEGASRDTEGRHTLHHEKAVVGPICTGSHKRLTLVQTCFLMDVLPAAGDPGQLVTARRPGVRSLRGELKDEMRAGEDRVNKRIDEVKDEMKDFKEQVRDEMRAGEARTNKRIDEVKEEMKEFKQEMGEIKTLLIQVLRLPPPGQP